MVWWVGSWPKTAFCHYWLLYCASKTLLSNSEFTYYCTQIHTGMGRGKGAAVHTEYNPFPQFAILPNLIPRFSDYKLYYVLFFLQLLMSLVAMAILLVHVLAKPYKRNITNIIETLILIDLVAVTITFIDPKDQPMPQEFRILLLILPYIYALLYVTWTVTLYVW